MNEYTAEMLTKTYVKIRDKRRELARQDDELKEQMDMVAAKLLEICNDQGASTIRTDFGTVSKRESKTYWSSDWNSFFKFVKENDAFDLLQQRIHTANMSQFLEDNPETVLPGLTSDTRQSVVIIKR